MIEITDVSKDLEGNSILKNIILQIHEKSIFGLIGQNGAGKTTLIKLITGIWSADQGEVLIDGIDVYNEPSIRQTIGYVPDQCHYYESWRAEEILHFYKLTYEKFSMERFNQINEIFNIGLRKKIRQLSKGMKMKLSIMLALSIMPKFLILDEPTSGLDPTSRKALFDLLFDEVTERSTTVFISTHNLYDVEQFCDSLAVIKNGEITFTGSTDEIKLKVRKLQVLFDNNNLPDLSIRKDVLKMENVGKIYHITTNDVSGNFEEWLKASGASFVEPIDMSLEEVFIYSNGGDLIYDKIAK